ncbi:MAG: YciI family protein, partial [Stenotrophobium sp.]
HDAPGTLSQRLSLRPQHRAHIAELQQAGRLIIAGPRPRIEVSDPGTAGYYGSLIIGEFDDLAAARKWAESDPYFQAGIFSQVDIQPFVKALP